MTAGTEVYLHAYPNPTYLPLLWTEIVPFFAIFHTLDLAFTHFLPAEAPFSREWGESHKYIETVLFEMCICEVLEGNAVE